MGKRFRRRTPKLGKVRGVIRQGDAFELIKEIKAGSVDLLLTSPPYWGLRSYGLRHREDITQRWESVGCNRDRVPPWDWYRTEGGVLGMEPFPEWYVTHLVEFFARAKRTLRATASVWVNLGDTYFARWSSIREDGRQGISEGRVRRRTPSGGYLHDKQLLLIPARFAIAMQGAGWILRNDLIWAKPYPIPRPESDRLRLSHEHWFHFVMRGSGGRPRYHYDLTKCENGTLDVVTYRTSNGHKGHSATFPPQLVERRIDSSCPVGGLVLDPFCGTAASVVAALRLGRHGTGFELSKRIARIGKMNLRNVSATGRKTVDGRKAHE
jgi:DNA modification methylase